ncbi:hypothetical protein BCR39DRAFT_509118 [Naematelia encephala]|uniref:Uncharacterized protein n=1 Tax=Naematelia encephala TaxID=71784 RepID=A0A1Y2BKQ7_9TREE|nr:hypothetical protein BCR39DRAFT_509118 [Naematelia encephala]
MLFIKLILSSLLFTVRAGPSVPRLVEAPAINGVFTGDLYQLGEHLGLGNISLTSFGASGSDVTKRDGGSCPVPDGIWNKFGAVLEEHPWAWVAVGVFAAPIVATSWYAAAAISVTAAIKAHRTMVATWNAQANQKRDGGIVVFAIDGALDPEGIINSGLGTTGIYQIDYSTGVIDKLGDLHTFSVPDAQAGRGKRYTSGSYVVATSYDGPIIAFNDQDMQGMVQDMLHAAWSGGSEACFSQSWCGNNGCEQLEMQVSSYNGVNIDNLWGNCCGINRNAQWYDFYGSGGTIG